VYFGFLGSYSFFAAGGYCHNFPKTTLHYYFVKQNGVMQVEIDFY
jgi:hypothetical protein